MRKDNGGDAFPIINVHQPWNRETGEFDGVQTEVESYGMSLRDYFAAEALNSVYFDTRKSDEQAEVQDMARLAYAIADAMLAERSKS